MPRSKKPKSQRRKYTLRKKRSKESYRANTPEAKARKLANLELGRSSLRVKVPRTKSKKLDIIRWAESEFYIPETRRAIRLMDWEKEFLIELLYKKVKPTLALLGTPKKCGKSTIAAIVNLYFLIHKKLAELYLIGPDIEQSQLVVYSKIRKAIRLNKRLSYLKADKSQITNRENDSFIRPLACSSTNAGLNPTLCTFDELWRFTSEETKAAFDEMTNIPAEDNLNLIVTYAGHAEDEDSILYRLYKKGIDQQEGLEDKDEKFLFRWYGEELYDDIPWVTPNYLTLQKNRLRPNSYARLHCNMWVSGAESFISSQAIDQCTHNYYKGNNFEGQVVIGVDVGLKHDCSAIAVVGRVDSKTLILVDHKVFVPDEKRHQTLDLESTVERALLNFNRKYRVKKVLYDPYQFQRSAATLKNSRLKMQEYPQTVGNTVEMSETLSDLLHNHRLMLYPDRVVRQHLLNAQVKETQRGWRIVKRKANRKIDLTIALALACQGAQQSFLTKSGRKGSVYIPGQDSPAAELHRKNLEQIKNIAVTVT